MKRKLLALIFSIAASVIYANAQITFGVPQKINDDWYFTIDSVSDYSSCKIDLKNWTKLDLPHDWSIEQAASKDFASCTGYLPGGVGWYCKDLFIPKSESDLKQYIYFDGVYNNSEVWINGSFLGYRPNGYVPFMYDITRYVKFGAENRILVKVDHSRYADSRWYTGSGIYRDVYRISSNYIHIDNWGVFVTTSEINESEAHLNIAISIVNESGHSSDLDVECRVYDKTSGSPEISVSRKTLNINSGSTATCDLNMVIKSPRLWDIDHPNLYRIEVSLFDEKGTQLDGTSVISGIRDIRFDPDEGFSLNGKNIKMKGVCLHHDAGALGSAVPAQVWRRRLLTLKEIGCNAIRMSHNPQAEAMYDLCDELGFLVMDEAFDEWEFPKKKWIEGWNIGTPGFDGYSRYFNDWAERDLSDMIKRDRNHPSIVLWSIGNEIDYPNDPYSHPILDHEGINQITVPGYKPDKPRAERMGTIAKRLVKTIKEIDTTRGVTAALAGVVMSNYTDYPSALDVTGYNYSEDRYLSDHISFPERIIYGSENRHEYKSWLAVKENKHIFGQFLWTGIDYLGEAGKWPSRGSSSGLIDLAGFMKPRGYYRQSLWSEKPMIYIGTSSSTGNSKNNMMDFWPEWNYSDGDTVRVAVFTNCDSVRIALNNKIIDLPPMRDPVTNAYYWDIPYEDGRLRAEGYNNGFLSAEFSVAAHGEADGINAVSDHLVMKGKGDIAHVALNIIDKSGYRVTDACSKVICDVSGGGELLKLENAEMNYVDGLNGNSAPAYHGRILAYIKSTCDEGTISVKFNVPELRKETELKLIVEPQ